MNTIINYRTIAAAGSVLWILTAAVNRPVLYHHEWACLILLMAVWVWVPLAFHLLHYPVKYSIWMGLAGYLFGGAFFVPADWRLGLLVLPWILIQLWAFKRGMDSLLRHPDSPGQWGLSAGQLFLIVGGMWAAADRMGIQPLGFDPAIVLLTAVHFHYAGFIFPLLAGWLYLQLPRRFSKAAVLLAIIAVPLTAVGITVAQLTGNYIPEALAATTVAISGWLCGWGYLQLALRGRPGWVRIFRLMVGVSLFFTMTLALGYALRPFFPVEWLNIPSMRAWHGTVNAIGVGGSGLLCRMMNEE